MSLPKPDCLPAVPTGPIVSLAYRVPLSKREELVSFLQEAVPFYEKPGGTRIALYESIDEPGLYLELVAYAGQVEYEADQLRVEQDPEMRRVLQKWHEFIEGALEVRRMRPITLDVSERSRT